MYHPPDVCASISNQNALPFFAMLQRRDDKIWQVCREATGSLMPHRLSRRVELVYIEAQLSSLLEYDDKQILRVPVRAGVCCMGSP